MGIGARILVLKVFLRAWALALSYQHSKKPLLPESPCRKQSNPDVFESALDLNISSLAKTDSMFTVYVLRKVLKNNLETARRSRSHLSF